MRFARLLQIIAVVSALVAVTLGLGTYTHADFTDLHMLFGLLVALALLILALMAVFTTDLRRLGLLSLVYAVIVPVFGVTQQMIWAGEWHWLIETAHLIVGFGAVGLISVLSARLMSRRQAGAVADYGRG